MTITVLIPTYRRVNDLNCCLNGLKHQTRPADQVIVIVRNTDIETWAFLETFDQSALPLCTTKICVAGQVAALNAGLAAASGTVIAITDDDAVPQTDWLERVEAYFLSNDRVGGVGGRDWVYRGDQRIEESREVVGRVQWFGRLVGNHHLGVGRPREVEFLKGANMSYRRTAIASLQFDEHLRGTGAQVHNDLAFSLAVKQAGWMLIYDPSVAVNHYPAQRFDEDQRGQFARLALINKVHNETLTLLKYLPLWRRTAFLIWGIWIGTSSYPGFLQCMRLLPREGMVSVQRLLAVLLGRWQGWQSWKESLRKMPQKPASEPIRV